MGAKGKVTSLLQKRDKVLAAAIQSAVARVSHLFIYLCLLFWDLLVSGRHLIVPSVVSTTGTAAGHALSA